MTISSWQSKWMKYVMVSIVLFYCISISYLVESLFRH